MPDQIRPRHAEMVRLCTVLDVSGIKFADCMLDGMQSVGDSVGSSADNGEVTWTAAYDSANTVFIYHDANGYQESTSAVQIAIWAGAAVKRANYARENFASP